MGEEEKNGGNPIVPGIGEDSIIPPVDPEESKEGENPPVDPEENKDGKNPPIDPVITAEQRLVAFREKFANKNFANPSATKGHFTKNPEDKAELEYLYKEILKKELKSGCKDCVVDAYVEIMKFKGEVVRREFELYAGALIEDNVGFDAGKAMSNHNLTTELVLFHLAQNPKLIDKFQKKPENWEELVQNYKERERG